MATLKYAPFVSEIELPFYTSLANHKINIAKLDDSARQLWGLYEIRANQPKDEPCHMQIRANALAKTDVPASCYPANGTIRNVNTIEDYRSLNKDLILKRAGATIWEAIKDGTILEAPFMLVSFYSIFFADLKKYKFVYHFAFPVIHSDTVWSTAILKPAAREQVDPEFEDRYRTKLTAEESTELVDVVQTWRMSVDPRQYGFFLAKKLRAGPRSTSSEASTDASGGTSRPATPATPGPQLNFTWAVASLQKFEKGFFDNIHEEDRFICFADPSTYESYPGWMLRNLLVLVQHRWKLARVRIISYRETHSRRHEANSLLLRLEASAGKGKDAAVVNTGSSSSMPKITGWERNSQGAIGPKVANLGEHMDPEKLANQAVDLNLKLIKWRIAPGLDLNVIKNTKCLLLGAGTLGSYVARNLLGWGVRKITFVDNGTVSFSNPVRQPLFNFKDCLEGGAKKATRAAEALKEIYPGVESAGYTMSVPMAGHPIIDEAKVKSEFEVLEKLIDEHDVVFLLMDTRESRWLPTVIAKSKGKLVMNAALGFDTFVVLRHGVKKDSSPGMEVGCYFCSDVVAPADSMSDRTLDQQCTVTRPGIAAIASALLVEMMVSVLQHPEGRYAPAPTTNSQNLSEHPLGIVPHQIRGVLSQFQNIVTNGQSYDCCSACSDKITGAFQKDGWEFVKRALNEKGYVEGLSGLAEVQRLAEAASNDIEWDEESGDGEGLEESELI